jgi:hypothetical protein
MMPLPVQAFDMQVVLCVPVTCSRRAQGKRVFSCIVRKVPCQEAQFRGTAQVGKNGCSHCRDVETGRPCMRCRGTCKIKRKVTLTCGGPNSRGFGWSDRYAGQAWLWGNGSQHAAGSTGRESPQECACLRNENGIGFGIFRTALEVELTNMSCFYLTCLPVSLLVHALERHSMLRAGTFGKCYMTPLKCLKCTKCQEEM